MNSKLQELVTKHQNDEQVQHMLAINNQYAKEVDEARNLLQKNELAMLGLQAKLAEYVGSLEDDSLSAE